MSESVVVQMPNSMPVPAAGGDPLLSIIERASRDPAVDIDKMQRLFEMHRTMQEQRAKQEFLAALNDMMPKMPIVRRNGLIEIPSKDNKPAAQKPTKFARWEDIDEAARPIYTAHGFSLTFRIEQTESRITAYAVLGHRGGHERETPFSSPIEGSGFKNNTQGWGSALSYCKRYAACAALNIVTTGDDDDGKKAGAPETISEAQEAQLRDLIEATESNLAIFCRYYKIGKISDLSVSNFTHAVAALNGKLKK
jgi:hypothetical protein